MFAHAAGRDKRAANGSSLPMGVTLRAGRALRNANVA
jgi:hypothetical protein